MQRAQHFESILTAIRAGGAPAEELLFVLPYAVAAVWELPVPAVVVRPLIDRDGGYSVEVRIEAPDTPLVGSAHTLPLALEVVRGELVKRLALDRTTARRLDETRGLAYLLREVHQQVQAAPPA